MRGRLRGRFGIVVGLWFEMRGGSEGERLWRCHREMRRSAVALASLGGQVEEIKRLERPSRIRFGASSALLEYAVMHGDEAEAERLRAALCKLTDEL